MSSSPFDKPMRIRTGFRRSFSFDYNTFEFPISDEMEVQVNNQYEHDMMQSIMSLRAMRKVYADISGFLPVIRISAKSSTGQAQCDQLQAEANAGIEYATKKLQELGTN